MTASTPTSSPASSIATDVFASDPTSDAYAVYEDRAVNGVFEDVIEGFTNMGHRSLGNAEYNVNFRRRIENWSGSYSYIDLEGGDEFKGVVFGQVMPASAGTIISAKGNHYGGKPGSTVGFFYDLASLLAVDGHFVLVLPHR
jgi:hypothetical protein